MKNKKSSKCSFLFAKMFKNVSVLCYYYDMNRNVLKIIALISMLVDHIGEYLLDNNIVFRIIGRIAFFIFAFFIAEGMKYTKNRRRYFLMIFVFAIISQIPFYLLKKRFVLNVLFVFLVSMILILIIEKLLDKDAMQNVKKIILYLFLLTLIFTGYFVLDWCALIDYSVFGALAVVCFYFFKSPTKFILAVVLNVLVTLKSVIILGFSLQSVFQIFAIIGIVLLLFYNNNKGKFNLKYLFYLFYPIHLMIIWLIIIII